MKSPITEEKRKVRSESPITHGKKPRPLNLFVNCPRRNEMSQKDKKNELTRKDESSSPRWAAGHR